MSFSSITKTRTVETKAGSFLLAQALAIASATLMAATPAQGAQTTQSASAEGVQEYFVGRMQHARELLGKAYRRSLAGMGDEEKEFGPFLARKIEERLPAKHRKQSRRILHAIFVESKRYGFDPAFLYAVIENESSFNPEVRGTSGEIGLMQILPPTAKWIADREKIAYRGDKSLLDPVMNIRLGASYLHYLRGEFDYHGRLYLSAYNMGKRNVKRALSKRVVPRDYASRVMQRYLKLYDEMRGEQASARRLAAAAT